MLPLDVIASSSRFVIVNKPGGLLSVPGKGPDKADCVIARVRKHFPHARGPLVVHRLDMETSGLLIVALDEDAQRELSRQFEAREVEKSYIAVLDGAVLHDSGIINVPLRPDIDHRPRQIVDFVHGRAAVTNYTVLAREPDRTRVRFDPITGRSHQLRVHAALPGTLPGGQSGGLGCPICGDVLYGDPTTSARLLLHAMRLVIFDPTTGARCEFTSPAPF